GHLSNRRLVAVGDIVQAGQVIGFEGRSGIENGGYKPHLHLAIREGRMFAPDATLMMAKFNGKLVTIKLVGLDENELEIETDEPAFKSFSFQIKGLDYAVTSHDGKLWLPAGLLLHFPRPDFPIVGYGLTTDGFCDPTEFLRLMLADIAPAPFGPVP